MVVRFGLVRGLLDGLRGGGGGVWWAIDRRGALEELGLWRPTVVGGVGVRVVVEALNLSETRIGACFSSA